MSRFSVVRITLALIAAAVAASLEPSAAAAQRADGLRGPFAGVGIGMGNVRDQGLEEQRLGPMLHGRLGWGLGRSITPMLELGVYGLGDDRPEIGDVVYVYDTPETGGAQTTQVLRTPSVLNIYSALASVQIGLPRGLYVRPGIGLGFHSFASYRLDPDAPLAETSQEGGPAAGIALGRTLNALGRFPIAVEGIALWSGGEDSTGSRWVAGLQIVPMLRF
jgi:hypothetical protein